MVREATGGELQVKWHTSAAMGDEISMLEKVRAGRFDGGIFSMTGLARISRSVHMLSLPLLFEDLDEARAVQKKLMPRFEDRFRSEGFVLFGFFALGFGRVFTVGPVEDLATLTSRRIWTLQGDETGAASLEALGFRSRVALKIPDVLPALREGRIDAFSGTYFSITVLQWFPFARAVIPLNWTYAFGGVVLGESVFSDLSPAQQAVVQRVMGQLVSGLAWQGLEAEKAAESGLTRKEGLEKTHLSEAEVSTLEGRARKFYPVLAREIREEKLLESVLRALSELRGQEVPGHGE